MSCVSLHHEWMPHTQGRAQELVTVKPQKSNAPQLHHLDHGINMKYLDFHSLTPQLPVTSCCEGLRDLEWSPHYSPGLCWCHCCAQFLLCPFPSVYCPECYTNSILKNIVKAKACIYTTPKPNSFINLVQKANIHHKSIADTGNEKMH